jgi:hypothetical protein
VTPSRSASASASRSGWREVARITVRTLFFFFLLLAVLLLWRGSGLFIYEGF